MSIHDRQAWMWANACELLTQAERLHRQFFRPSGATRHVSWEPPVDLIEDGAHLLLTVALPGVKPENVSLRIESDGVAIEAVRPRGLNGGMVRRMEIPYGRFARRIPLPPGIYELQEQLFRNGCLSVRFAKR